MCPPHPPPSPFFLLCLSSLSLHTGATSAAAPLQPLQTLHGPSSWLHESSLSCPPRYILLPTHVYNHDPPFPAFLPSGALPDPSGQRAMVWRCVQRACRRPLPCADSSLQPTPTAASHPPFRRRLLSPAASPTRAPHHISLAQLPACARPPLPISSSPLFADAALSLVHASQPPCAARGARHCGSLPGFPLRASFDLRRGSPSFWPLHPCGPLAWIF